MAEEIESTLQDGAVTTVVRDPNYKVIYVNHCRANVTPYDIQMTFSQLRIVDAASKQQLEEQVTLIVAASEAKAVRDILTKVVQAYEENYGAVPYNLAHMPAYMLEKKDETD